MFEDDRILECPACHKRLVKVELKSIGIIVDICLDSCGGIYFGNKELPAVLASPDAIEEIKKVCEGKEFKKVEGSELRKCPFCASKMVKNYTSYSREIQIDECYRCGGKFLDSGELEKIKAINTEDDAAAMMKDVQAMFGKDLNITSARHSIDIKHNPRNKRTSFFINMAEKFFKK